jgi:hypothetical protein
MRKLLDFLGGLFLGCVVAFLFWGVFDADPVQVKSTQRAKKAQCEAYKEELLSPQSPKEKMHQAQLYSKLCEEVQR